MIPLNIWCTCCDPRFRRWPRHHCLYQRAANGVALRQLVRGHVQAIFLREMYVAFGERGIARS